MTTQLSPYPKLQFFDNNGAPLAGGLLFTYQAGTSTPQPTYTDSTGSVANANPVVLDSAGRANIWLGSTPYKFVLEDTFSNVIWTVDNIVGSESDILNKLAATDRINGSNLIGYKAPGAGATPTTVQGALDNLLSVEEYGAVGDGVTNDSAAFLAMAAANNGYVRMRTKNYFVGNLIFPSTQIITMVGEGMPVSDGGFTQLLTGTVLIGGVTITANEVRCENFGIDAGTAHGIAIGTYDGLVINAQAGQQGIMCIAKNISAMGTSSTGTTHGVLIQGYSRGIAHNIYCAQHQFGLVVKSHNFVISDISGDLVRTALVYPKSDTPAFGGGVLDATAYNMEITNVSYRPGSTNTEGSAVYIQSSTLTCTSIRVSNVSTIFGFTAVRIQGGGTLGGPYVGDVAVTNTYAESAQFGFYSAGYTYDWTATNINATNPATGCIVTMDTTTTNWQVANVNLLITNSGITSTSATNFFGTGVWDNISVRNPFNNMFINVATGSISSIRSGTRTGNVSITGEGTLTGINGAVAVAPAPRLEFMPGSQIKLAGRFQITGSTNKFFCNLPVTTGLDMIFAGGYIDSTGAYQTCAIRLNSFQLSIEPTLPTGAQFVDISGITIPIV